MLNLLLEQLEVKTNGLFMAVLGASGVGKSHFIGTYPGRTLLVYSSAESHGPGSAVKEAKSNLIPVAYDRVKDKPLDSNVAWTRLLDILNPEAIKAAEIKCVALDSITALALEIKTTDLFKQRCMGAKGQHNAFKETEALIEMLNIVMRKLQILHDYHGIDVLVTMDLQIQAVAENGLILESKPGLPTFGCAKAIVQQFSDILVLSRINQKPIFQNGAKASSASKDADGNMVKYIEFFPRLRGVGTLPEYITPTVPAIFELKSDTESK